MSYGVPVLVAVFIGGSGWVVAGMPFPGRYALVAKPSDQPFVYRIDTWTGKSWSAIPVPDDTGTRTNHWFSVREDGGK